MYSQTRTPRRATLQPFQLTSTPDQKQVTPFSISHVEGEKIHLPARPKQLFRRRFPKFAPR